MYMTRMELDLTRRETLLALAAPGKLHGAIESGFAGERRRRLWRVDELNGRSYVLIVSEDVPNLTAAAAQFGPADALWQTRNYDPFLRAIAPGSVWHFRLSANPTVSVPGQKGERGRVCAHVTAQQQKKWLLDRAQKHGFALREEDFEVVRRKVVTFNKGESRRRVTLGTCVFEGRLKVTDADLLRQALTQGIGRGKAYGLGLLTLAADRRMRQGGEHE